MGIHRDHRVFHHFSDLIEVSLNQNLWTWELSENSDGLMPSFSWVWCIVLENDYPCDYPNQSFSEKQHVVWNNGFQIWFAASVVHIRGCFLHVPLSLHLFLLDVQGGKCQIHSVNTANTAFSLMPSPWYAAWSQNIPEIVGPHGQKIQDTPWCTWLQVYIYNMWTFAQRLFHHLVQSLPTGGLRLWTVSLLDCLKLRQGGLEVKQTNICLGVLAMSQFSNEGNIWKYW